MENGPTDGKQENGDQPGESDFEVVAGTLGGCLLAPLTLFLEPGTDIFLFLGLGSLEKKRWFRRGWAIFSCLLILAVVVAAAVWFYYEVVHHRLNPPSSVE